MLALLLCVQALFSGGLCAFAEEAEEPFTLPELPLLKDTRPSEYKETTFVTLNGDEVTYNRNTRKIVCVFGSQDVVAFGIPLLAYEGSTDIEGYEDFYDGATALMNTTPYSPEEILSYEPELILVNQRMSASNIAALSKIAPVIPLYTDSTDFATRLRYIGDIFGLQESAETLIAYADALRDGMTKQLKNLGLADKTLTIYTYMDAISIPPERGWFMNTILYDYVGLKRLPIVEEFMQDEGGVAYEVISAEKLRDYEGDMVIYRCALLYLCLPAAGRRAVWWLRSCTRTIHRPPGTGCGYGASSCSLRCWSRFS